MIPIRLFVPTVVHTTIIALPLHIAAMETKPTEESLRRPLGVHPISQDTQDAISRELFGMKSLASPRYFEFYAKRIQRHILGGKPFCLRDHYDLARVGKMIFEDLSREEVRTRTPSRPENRNTVDDAIDLCASVLVMTDISMPGLDGTPTSHGVISGRTTIPWETGVSLRATLACYFIPQKHLDADNPKLGRVFTARNISKIGGIEIRWTTNLEDHLRLVDDDQAVLVFCGARFLQVQSRIPNSLLPKALISETLETLALLFPSTDRATEKWLRQSGQLTVLPEPEIGRCGALRTSQRRIDNFSIWHDRLVILKQAFDDSQPATLSQWWFDRRNRVQWYTFWVAILVFVMTMFFGLVQSIEGALQVYLAYQGQGEGH